MKHLDAFEKIVKGATAPIIDIREAHNERIPENQTEAAGSRTSSEIAVFGWLTIKTGLGLAAIGAVSEALSIDAVEKPSVLVIAIGLGGAAVGGAVTLYEKLSDN